MSYYTESETYEQASIESSYRTNNETSGIIFASRALYHTRLSLRFSFLSASYGQMPWSQVKLEAIPLLSTFRYSNPSSLVLY